MHGMIPPEPNRKDAAVADGFAGFSAFRQATQRQLRPAPGTPLPPQALSGGVWALDALAFLVAGLAARDMVGQGLWPHLGAVVLGVAAGMLVASLAGAHAHRALFLGRRALLAALGGPAAAVVALAVAARALGVPEAFPATVALGWLALGLPLVLAGRVATARVLRAETYRARRRVVVVGDGPHGARFVAAMQGRPDVPIRLLGVVDDRRRPLDDVHGRSGLPHLGPIEVLEAMVRRGEVDEVVLALPWSAERRVADLAGRLADYPVDVRLAPDLCAYHGRGLDGDGKLRLLDRPIQGWGAALKRAEDVVLALAALAVAAVPMALVALAIRLDSPGPILFRQRRTGFNNRDFHVLKFRTMYDEATDHEARVQVLEGDPRVTPVGAILRRTSLDELPQLFNVLRGEMSFVGPRPHAPGTRAGGRLFEQVVARYAARHRVKPGLTGLAQVRGWRGPTETEVKLVRRVESDLEYIETWSPWLDIAIILRTLVAVARMRNAL